MSTSPLKPGSQVKLEDYLEKKNEKNENPVLPIVNLYYTSC